MNPIKDIVIVGGGTAGLISALYIQHYFPLFNIKIIQSSKLGIVGVGEGSTEHWAMFMDQIGIDPLELINETNATIKIGILFNDWSYLGSTYCHSISSFPIPFNLPQQVNEIYNRLVLNNTFNNPFILTSDFKEIFYQNRLPLIDNLHPPSNQFHFDTLKLNSYLVKKCKERKIEVIDTIVKDINQDINGNIVSLVTDQTNNINGDFFIDASGFKKILSSKSNNKTISYTEYLPVNQAITLSTNLDLKKGIEPYTKCTALSSGWAWKIPTQERYGNGYVFDNRYINADNALNEFNTHLGTNIEKVAKNIKFEAYKKSHFWHKNYVSIGLAGSFAEPLEAQSIGFSIIQSKLLVEHLNGWQYNPTSVSQKYNEVCDNTFDNIISYVQLHYLTQRNDSKFWKDKPFKLTEFNKNTLPRFSSGVFTSSDFIETHMFKHLNFYQIYYGVNLLNKTQIKQNLKYVPKEHLQEWDRYYKELINTPTPNSISHTDYLKLIRENYSS